MSQAPAGHGQAPGGYAEIAPRPDRKPRAPRPRDAATLIIIDRSSPIPRILMGRRSDGHSFMPGVWVFPGGRIDRQDFGVTAVSELSADAAPHAAMGLDPRRARALAATAVRETFEETGLLLGAPLSDLPKKGAWQDFFRHGVAPDLGALSYIGRLITPPHRHKRFDTRFFITDMCRLVSADPIDSRELQEVNWFSLEETEALDLALPTKLVLNDLRVRLKGSEKDPFFRRFRSPRGK